MQLVLLTDLIPNLLIDMRYASIRNIAHRPISDEYAPRLHTTAAQALATVATDLNSQGYRLVIWDAYRSLETQAFLRTVINNNRYVLEISKHCQGLALDLTLATIDGKLLDMGTDHDDFTERAHADATNLTEAQKQHRQILVNVMRQQQFRQWPFEWWHFDFIS